MPTAFTNVCVCSRRLSITSLHAFSAMLPLVFTMADVFSGSNSSPCLDASAGALELASVSVLQASLNDSLDPSQSCIDENELGCG